MLLVSPRVLTIITNPSRRTPAHRDGVLRFLAAGVGLDGKSLRREKADGSLTAWRVPGSLSSEQRSQSVTVNKSPALRAMVGWMPG